MHGYKMKNIRPWNVSNHADWRSKMGQIRGGRSVLSAESGYPPPGGWRGPHTTLRSQSPYVGG